MHRDEVEGVPGEVQGFRQCGGSVSFSMVVSVGDRRFTAIKAEEKLHEICSLLDPRHPRTLYIWQVNLPPPLYDLSGVAGGLLLPSLSRVPTARSTLPILPTSSCSREVS